MASGIPLLSTLLVMVAALIVYRVILLYYVRGRLWRSSSQDLGRVEGRVGSWWRRGAFSILAVGLLTMFAYVVVIGADLLSPVGDSIEWGIIYAILGIGLALTYAVVKLPNFAHGEMATIGAYAMALTHTLWDLPLPFAFASAAAAGAGLGLLQHMLVYRPLIGRGAKLVQIMIASFALSLILRSIFWMFAAYYNIIQYSPVSRNLLKSISIFGVTLWNCDPRRACRIGEFPVTDLFLWLILVAVPLVISLHLLLTRTLIGKSMRAIADNIELSQVTGINVENIRRITWLLTGALAGIGGAFLGIETPIGPELGWNHLLRVFAAVTLGGLVSFYGTIAGGVIVGFGEQWITFVGATYIDGFSNSWQPFMAFLIIVLALLIRPAGLSGLTFPQRVRNQLREHINLRARRKESI